MARISGFYCRAVVACICLAIAIAPQVTRAIEHDKPFGEPYELLGRRLVFTTWYFVRPGQLEWRDPETNSPYPGDAKVGPFDAVFNYDEHPFGIRLVAEPAQDVGPVVVRDRPWEKLGLSINVIIAEDGKYRAWGVCQDADRNHYDCYLESKDCLTWEKPDLGQVEFKGNRENNLIGHSPGTVFLDPTSPAEQRYKAVKHGHFDREILEEYKQRRPASVMATELGSGWGGDAIVGSVSPDGLQWTQLPQPLSIEPSDTQIVAGYDPRLQKYVMFTRSHMIGSRAPGASLPIDSRHIYVSRRAIGRSESENFQEFPLSEIVVEPGSYMAPSESYYSNSYTTIPGAPDHHLMFPAVYHQDEDTTSIDLFASYDGKTWHRAPGSPVLDTNRFGKWDGGCVFMRPNLVELPDGSWAAPYTGYLYPHKYPRGAWAYDAGLAVWPKGRLMALQAKEHGEFTTVAIIAPGSTLRINAVTERSGGIRIEVADLKGNIIPGRSFADAAPIVGDQYQTVVTWKGAGDLGVAPGQPLVLRFRMDKAKLYGLEFE